MWDEVTTRGCALRDGWCESLPSWSLLVTVGGGFEQRMHASEGGRVCAAARSGRGGKTALLGVLLALAGCRQQQLAPEARPPRCETVTEIAGEYRCSGECIVTDAAGQRQVLRVSDETDIVQRFPGAEAPLYQVNITGGGGFSELEVGALVGDTLRAATAAVSDDQYPVLEEYVFETDSSCRARGFAKVVRNPSKAAFKSCSIRCQLGE